MEHNMKNRIWIELDTPNNDEHAEEQCRLANNMLQRLAEKPEYMQRQFFWLKNSRRYAFGGLMGYNELTDRGEWFNLDYLGRDIPADQTAKLIAALEESITAMERMDAMLLKLTGSAKEGEKGEITRARAAIAEATAQQIAA
jgi:uncharacterized protein CbrC (UPF0167 family)